MNEKHKLTKTSNETTSSAWLLPLMAKAVLRQQFRNSAYSPTLEAKTEVMEDWSRLAARIGRARFSEGLMEAFLHTTFIPSCEDIEKYAPAIAEETGMYKPFPKLEAPKDRPTPEQLERMETLLRKIKMNPAKVAEVMPQARKEPKSSADRQELQEVQSKGMKAKVIDRKAEAANDK